MATEQSRREVVARIFRGTGSRYDEIVVICTGGQDRTWKEGMIDLLEHPRRVLDLACGTGILTFMLRDRFQEIEVVGVDMTEELLEVARQRALKRHDSHVQFLLSPAELVPLTGRFDAILSSYLPKYANLKRLLPRLVDRLERRGVLAMQDFIYPEDPDVARAWRWGFKRQLEWARGSLPEAVEMFELLPDVIRHTRWVAELTTLMGDHGLGEVTSCTFNNGQLAMVWGRKMPQDA